MAAPESDYRRARDGDPMNGPCPPWCEREHDRGWEPHFASVAHGFGANGGSVGVTIGRGETTGPQVYLHLHETTPTKTLAFTPEKAAAWATVLLALGAAEWVGEALADAARILGVHSAAEASDPATDPATPVAG